MFDTKDALKDKQTNPQDILEQQNVRTISDEDIHQMPEKFLPKKAGKKKASDMAGAQKKILLIIVVLIFFLSALISGAIIYLNKYADTGNEQPAGNTTENVVQEEPVVEGEEVATSTESVEEEEPVVEGEEVATSTESVEEEEPVVEEEEEIVLDVDNDNLTIFEEELFKTNPNDDDTDKDGYKDGSELVNLYDPSVSAQALVDSGMVTIYNNPNYSYSIFFPSQWVSLPLTADSSQIKFLTNKDSGESVIVQAFANDNNWDIQQYKISTNLQGLTDYPINATPGFLSADGLTFYTINENFLYQIRLDKNFNQEDNFPTVFAMMLNSFEMKQIAPSSTTPEDEDGSEPNPPVEL